MGMDLGPDVDDVVRVQFQLYLLQGFLNGLETFLLSPRSRRIPFSAMAVFLLPFTALSMDFHNQLRDLCVSGSSNHKRGPRQEGEL